MSNMVVQTNVLALNSHRNMKNVGAVQARASGRLSSGYRINNAADDAAGLAISEKMRAQIRGLDQASRNAQDAQALINTAEGGMQEIDNMVQRIRELVVQAANDTNEQTMGETKNQGDRRKIQDEIENMVQEIDSMASRVEFNGKRLIDGTYAAGDQKNLPNIQTTYAPNSVSDSTTSGANAVTLEDRAAAHAIIRSLIDDQTNAYAILVQKGLSTTTGAAAQALFGGGAVGTQGLADLAALKTAMTDISKLNPKNVTEEDVKKAVDALKLLNAHVIGSTADSTVQQAIKDLEPMLAEALELVKEPRLLFIPSGGVASEYTKGLAVSASGSYQDFASYSGIFTLSSGVSANMSYVIGTSYATFMDAFESTRNAWIALLTTTTKTDMETLGQAFLDTFKADVDKAVDKGTKFVIGTTTATISATVAAATLTALTKNLGEMLSNKLANFAGPETLPAGDAKKVSESLSALMSTQFAGSTNTLQAVLEDDDYVDTYYAWAELRDLKSADGLEAAWEKFSSTLFKDYLAKTFPNNSAMATASSAFDLTSLKKDFSKFFANKLASLNAAAPDASTGGTKLYFQVGANANQRIEAYINSVRSDALGLGNGDAHEGGAIYLDVVQATGADITNLLKGLDAALTVVTTERSKLGAISNRLDFTMKSLDISSENLSDSESRIRDADMAKEMMTFTKSNVLQQAAISMLAQANQLPQNLLQLLR